MSLPTAAKVRLRLVLLSTAFAAMALWPWWKNHNYLRDFYDYGLFINVNARLDAGQRPFADFTTPAQSATFWFNHLAERLGGGTYIGMTYGAAALILIACVGMSLILARRLTPFVACLMAGAIAACSASQHTIIFYNPLGVFAMALVVWSFAIAPILRREHLGWHAVAAAGLVLGGLNKINFHLLTCAMAAGWIVWGAIETRSSWRRVTVTFVFLAGFGLLVPPAIELAWTGAGWRTWYYNVVELPLRARGDRVFILHDLRLYFTTLHDYYGRMRVPQAGLLIVLLPLIAVIAAWCAAGKSATWPRRALVAAAGLCGALSGMALLLTNNEIAYLTLAAAMVMLTGLWLGFRLPTRGAWPLLALGLPAAVLGFYGWESAYQGQRSQFGHSDVIRSEYVSGEKSGPSYGYLAGLRLPPQMVASLEGFVQARNKPGTDAERVFYGLGTEWLERVWPSPKVAGLPLIVAAFDSQRELDLVRREVIEGDSYQHLLVVGAWNTWPPSLQESLLRRFSMDPVGPNFFIYNRFPSQVLWSKPLEFERAIGGNVDTTMLLSGMAVETLPDGRQFAGITQGDGQVQLAARSSRASGHAVLKRVQPHTPLAEPVRFEVFAVGEGMRLPRWSRELMLPDGTDELEVSTEQIDASGLMLDFTVSIPESVAGKVAAGWRNLRLSDTHETITLPPSLQPASLSPRPAEPKFREALLPDQLKDTDVLVRLAELRDGAAWLPPRAEVWVRLSGRFSKIELTAKIADSPAQGAPRPYVLYYKGGRIEHFHADHDEANNISRYRVWSPEGGGWLAIIAEAYGASPPFTIRIDSTERQ